MKTKVWKSIAYVRVERGNPFVDMILQAEWPDWTEDAWEASMTLTEMSVEEHLKKMGFKDAVKQWRDMKTLDDIKNAHWGKYVFKSDHKPSLEEVTAAVYAKLMGETVSSIHYAVDESIPDIIDKDK